MVEIFKDRALMFSADDGFWIAVNDEGTGPYLTDGLFTLTEGEQYTIVINGAKYTGEAVTANVTGVGEVIGIGNADALTGGAGNGEPYAAGFTQASADASTFILAWLDPDTAAEAYTVSLYEGVEEEEEPDTPVEEETPGANIVLYDRNGEPVTYEGIETVSFNTAEGDIATYTHGTATDEVAVPLDLSAGNQTVTPAEADFMKTVVIEKPDTLLPENIKRGVEIAGVAGNLIGEGVSKEVELSLAAGDQTVEADPETLMAEVIIKKPETLLPENIAKDIEIAGVVGTFKGGGAGYVPSSDINFYDYDGTIVASWTLEELASATALPTNPEHDGLISQGWNWTLEDLKTTNRAMNVGQMYTTDDGATRLYIRNLADVSMTVPLYFSQTVANGVTIDWGDGSATQTLAGTGNVNTTHTYASIGDYVISLTPAEGCTLGLSGSLYNNVLGQTSVSANKAYFAMLHKVEIGANVTAIGDYAFYYCRNLNSITIPAGVQSIGKQAFNYCDGIRNVILPNGAITIGQQAFDSAYGLETISLPNTITDIVQKAFYMCKRLRAVTLPNSFKSIQVSTFDGCDGFGFVGVSDNLTSVLGNAFNCCYGLARIDLPAGVTSIGSMAFMTCASLREIHLKATTPPTLGSNALVGAHANLIIYVPTGCLSAYQAADKWSTFASQMQEES